MPLIRIRIKGTGQVLDVIPAVARARLNGGTAELVEVTTAETAAIKGAPNTAVSSAQHAPPKPGKPKKK